MGTGGNRGHFPRRVAAAVLVLAISLGTVSASVLPQGVQASGSRGNGISNRAVFTGTLEQALPPLIAGHGEATSLCGFIFRTLKSCVPSRTLRTGDFLVTWENGWLVPPSLKVAHSSSPERVLWESVGGRWFVSAAVAQARVAESRGSFRITDSVVKRCRRQTVDSIQERAGSVVIRGRFPEAGGRLSYEMVLTGHDEGRLDFDVRLRNRQNPEGTYNRVFLSYASSPDERFFGFGAQYTHLDMKGRLLPVLSQEQGIGRG